MRRILLIIALLLVTGRTFAKNSELVYTEASHLTLVGKLMPNTSNPYHRVDTAVYKGFTKLENFQVRMSAGIAVAFSTNSSRVAVRAEFGQTSVPDNSTALTARGFDLYCRNSSSEPWLWAGDGVIGKSGELVLVSNMTQTKKEFLLYLPLFSEVKSVQVGVDAGCGVNAIANPLRHRIGIFGSSFTHGTSTGRAGMPYPAQLARLTGLQLLSLGCSGRCKLQPYFADVLAAAPDVDAFIFDSFSNPSIDEIKSRLFPFIEKVQAAHPGIPLIFQRTIRREHRNFDVDYEKREASRIAVADSMMAIATKRYKDVYYIYPNATSADHNASIDGIHPSNYGYTLWAESIMEPVKQILKKYGIE